MNSTRACLVSHDMETSCRSANSVRTDAFGSPLLRAAQREYEPDSREEHPSRAVSAAFGSWPWLPLPLASIRSCRHTGLGLHRPAESDFCAWLFLARTQMRGPGA